MALKIVAIILLWTLFSVAKFFYNLGDKGYKPPHKYAKLIWCYETLVYAPVFILAFFIGRIVALKRKTK